MVLKPIPLHTTAPLGSAAVFSDLEIPTVRPFVKWVGGKSQLLNRLDAYLPESFKEGKTRTYVEPFLGGGAVYFHLAQKYEISRFIISDSNSDLILAYWTIQKKVGELLLQLHDFQLRYNRLAEAKREEFYYRVREQFNKRKRALDTTRYSDEWIIHTAQLIFLNKTGFNGLFRVNSSGGYNVAFGKYENPRICDTGNLVRASDLLKRAEIYLCDFEQITRFVDHSTFIYLDPPYRPLTETAKFTGYSSDTFTSYDQERLAKFCRKAANRDAKILLSNSDPTNVRVNDNFFEENYENFRIVRTEANRMVNCKADKRGKIRELLIMNYGDAQI